MPTREDLRVADLSLDMHNFRTVEQKNETKAIHALIALKPDWFWALTKSLLDDGYHLTENILVIKGPGGLRTVKEGNRRIAAMKLLLGLVPLRPFDIPDTLQAEIRNVSDEWKRANRTVPCAIFESSEIDVVNRIVALTHGKGEQAGRDKWKAVARARHNRNENDVSEPALDLLEAYLKHGKNINKDDAELWGGVYPLTVLEELLKRTASRFGAPTSRELADGYPDNIKYRATLERMLHDIGTEALTFTHIRATEDFAEKRYGMHALASAPPANPSPVAAAPQPSTPSTRIPPPTAMAPKRVLAVSANDPVHVKRTLKDFKPKGRGREKVATLVEEARKLKLGDTPHAFCFVLRSLFELSAKAYCADQGKAAGLTTFKPDGSDRKLVDVLQDIKVHLCSGPSPTTTTKEFHAAYAELAKQSGPLSVTSMNQLVHGAFVVDESHIAVVFHNVFPLLDAMNR